MVHRLEYIGLGMEGRWGRVFMVYVQHSVLGHWLASVIFVLRFMERCLGLIAAESCGKSNTATHWTCRRAWADRKEVKELGCKSFKNLYHSTLFIEAQLNVRDGALPGMVATILRRVEARKLGIQACSETSLWETRRYDLMVGSHIWSLWQCARETLDPTLRQKPVSAVRQHRQ